MDEYISPEDEARYAANRQLFPGLVGQQQGYARVWMGLAIFATVSLIVGAFWSVSRISAVRQEKSRGFVVVVGQDGKRLDLPVYLASEWRKPDRMVVDRLIETVTCLHSLDKDLVRARECWAREATLFVGDAVTRYDSWKRQAMDEKAVRMRLQDAPVRVTGVRFQKDDDWSKTHPDTSRYTLFWTTNYGNTKKPVKWDGWFVVRLLELDEDPQSSGIEYVDADWKESPVARVEG